MKWILDLTVAAYFVGKAIQNAIDENRTKRIMLENRFRKESLPNHRDCGVDALIGDCYEEIESEVCDEERY